MAREPMSQNQKFALIVFGMVLLLALVIAYNLVKFGNGL